MVLIILNAYKCLHVNQYPKACIQQTAEMTLGFFKNEKQARGNTGVCGFSQFKKKERKSNKT